MIKTIKTYAFAIIYNEERTKKAKMNILKQKKILIFTHDLSTTGAPSTLLGLVEILKEKGFFVVIHSPIDGPLKKDFEKLNIPVFVFKRRWFMLLFPTFKFFNLAICNTIVSYKAVKILQKMNIKHFWWVHESSFLNDIFEKYPQIIPVLKEEKNIYAVSDFAKSYIEKINPNVKVLNFGIKDRFDDFNNIESNDDIITFCAPSTIIPIKGYDVLLSAFLKLDETYQKKCKIKIIGTIGDSEYFKQIKKLSLGFDNIIYLDGISHEDTLKEIKTSTAIVLPSKGDSYPTVIMEALMFDKIVILSNKTGISDFITNKENGFVFDIDYPQKLSEYLKAIIDNPLIIKKNAARELFLKEFSFNIYKKQIELLLKNFNL